MELSKDMQPGSSFTDRQFITTLTDISLFSSYIAPIGNTGTHNSCFYTGFRTRLIPEQGPNPVSTWQLLRKV